MTPKQNRAGQFAAQVAPLHSTNERAGSLSWAELQALAGAGPDGLLQAKETEAGAAGKGGLLWGFLSHFWGPVPWLTEIAALLSALAHRWETLAIILALLLVNAHLGFWEEYRASSLVATIREMLG